MHPLFYRLMMLLVLAGFTQPPCFAESKRDTLQSQKVLMARAKKTKHKAKRSRQNDAVTEDQSADQAQLGDVVEKRRPRWSLESNPVGLLYGVLNAEANFPIWRKETIGPTGSYLNYGVVKGMSIGATGYHYFGPLFNQWFVNGTLSYTKIDINFLGIGVSTSGISLSVVGGYKWLFDNFIVAVGGGFTYYMISVDKSAWTEDVNVPFTGLRPGLMLNIGIPFY